MTLSTCPTSPLDEFCTLFRHPLREFLFRKVYPTQLLATNEYGAYRTICQDMRHATIEHGKHYLDGLTHTITIEECWTLLRHSQFTTAMQNLDTHGKRG